MVYLGDRKGTTKKLCDKDFAEFSGELFGAICLKTLALLPVGNALDLLRIFFGAVRVMLWLCESFLAPDFPPLMCCFLPLNDRRDMGFTLVRLSKANYKKNLFVRGERNLQHFPRFPCIGFESLIPTIRLTGSIITANFLYLAGAETTLNILGGSQKGGFQKGGFGGCSPGTKTGTRVRSPKPPFWKPPFYLPVTLFGVDKRVVSKRVVSADVPPERKPERGYIRQNHPFTKPPFYLPVTFCLRLARAHRISALRACRMRGIWTTSF